MKVTGFKCHMRMIRKDSNQNIGIVILSINYMTSNNKCSPVVREVGYKKKLLKNQNIDIPIADVRKVKLILYISL